jgi:hypothetical protein
VPDNPSTLWKYRDLPEALVGQSKLAANGIACFLADDEVVRVNWFWSNAFGGIPLFVREDDGGAALATLGQEIPAGFTAEETGEEDEQPVCPDCGSRDVDFEAVNKGIALAAEVSHFTLIDSPGLVGVPRLRTPMEGGVRLAL